jgi:hypothetical protein
MAIRRCLSSGGCLREKYSPEDDFIDVQHRVGGVKAVLLAMFVKPGRKMVDGLAGRMPDGLAILQCLT